MRRFFGILALVPALSALLVLPGCGGGDEGSSLAPGGEETSAQATGNHPYQQYFQSAAEEFGVPAPLLVAIGYAETRLYHVPGEQAEFEGLAPAFGVMALRGESLERGAALAGLTVEEVQHDTSANIRAAAALLDASADELGFDRSDLGAWAPAVAAYGGLPTLEAQSQYVHDEVYRLVREGIASPEDSGLSPILEATPDVSPAFPGVEAQVGPGPGSAVYAGAVWRPSPTSNYTAGRTYGIELLVIHTCAGSYSSCWSWLTTPYPTNPYKTSVHYVVNESGSEVSALVDEKNTAHHVGASFQGYPTNPRSIGIEHGGYSYAGANVWTEGQIATSAKLSCDIVKRNNIIRDRQHVIGHYQPDPVNRPNDPGTDFPWSDYMNRINTCVTGGGGGGGSGTITVDSNNASNNAANARMVAPSANWVASTNVAGYYGSGYWVAPTEAVSDGANFEFYLPSAASKQIWAWWTSATDRSTTAPFVVFDANGTKLGTVNKNQQTGGGAWQSIGTFNFTAGWNRVTVSRWTTAGYQVVADAIQVR